MQKNLKVFFEYHPFFLLIFLGYLVSYLIFGSFTLFYVDRLDNEVVYNHILGNFYKGDYDAVKIFLNGETKIYWLRRLLQPFSLLYIFNTEFAYWTIDILAKIISYFSFFVIPLYITTTLGQWAFNTFFFTYKRQRLTGTCIVYSTKMIYFIS